MTQVLELMTLDQEAGEDVQGEYFFYTGLAPADFRILGWTTADCWVCAWRWGYRQWPDARWLKMALMLASEPADRVLPCQNLRGRPEGGGPYLFLKGQKIVALYNADCKRCAWRMAYSHFSDTRIATRIPCVPADVNLRCRGSKRGGADAGP